MDELKIIGLEQTDITNWDFVSIKEELSKVLEVYKTVVYTDETIKTAKNDKSTLAKAKKLVEDQRKAYKAKCLAPYEALEPKVKELVAMIEEQRIAIDNVIKDYTERQKQEKETEIRAYYDKKAFVLGEYAAPLYEKLLDTRWLNVSTSKAKCEEEIQVAIQNALMDLNTIKEMESPFVKNLMEKYVDTLSVDEVKAKNQELLEATKEVIIVSKSQDKPVENIQLQENRTDISAGVNIKVYANQSQINQICDFMQAIGVTYEIQ